MSLVGWLWWGELKTSFSGFEGLNLARHSLKLYNFGLLSYSPCSLSLVYVFPHHKSWNLSGKHHCCIPIKLLCIHASWHANKHAPCLYSHLLDGIRVVYLALNAAGVAVPSVLLVDVVLRFVFFCCCCQSSRRKVEQARCWIKGFLFICIFVGRVRCSPDVVLVVLRSRQNPSPVSANTTHKETQRKNAPAMAGFQEVIKKFEVVMPQTWVFSVSVALRCRLGGIEGVALCYFALPRHCEQQLLLVC